MVWEDTGLAWSQTSPHIPDPVNAHLYVGPAMAASVTTNVNDGVGWTTPFEVLGPEFVEADYKAGKLAALNSLKGQVMKLSKGKANPALVGEILERKLKI
jgi:uncharacterized protein YbbC (DUF1343 family)